MLATLWNNRCRECACISQVLEPIQLCSVLNRTAGRVKYQHADPPFPFYSRHLHRILMQLEERKSELSDHHAVTKIRNALAKIKLVCNTKTTTLVPIVSSFKSGFFVCEENHPRARL